MTSPWNLRGRVAVITGAGSGIGAALAQALAARGMHLALADRRAEGLAATARAAEAQGVHVSTHVFDVTEHGAAGRFLDEALRAHGAVHVLVNNAGVAVGGQFLQVAEADFDWLLEVNFHSLVRFTRTFLPHLQSQDAAHIVNISSIFGIIAPPGQTAYAASKFAVRGFSEALRHELEMNQSPVTLTVVHPGGVRTRIAEDARQPAQADPAVVAQQMERARRMLKLPPEQAAESIAGAIEARTPRLLVGPDAKVMSLVQRLFPVHYWKRAARVFGVK